MSNAHWKEIASQFTVPTVSHASKYIPISEAGRLELSTLAEIGAFTARLDEAMRHCESEAQDVGAPLLPLLPDLPPLALEYRELVHAIIEDYRNVEPQLAGLPAQPIHNALCERTICMMPALLEPARIAILETPDELTKAPRIFDLAAVAAATILTNADTEAAIAAVVSGYHAITPLSDGEIGAIWPLTRMIMARRAVAAGQAIGGEGEAGALPWRVLERTSQSGAVINARLRHVCAQPVSRDAIEIMGWLDSRRGRFARIVGVELSEALVKALSVEESTVPLNPFHMTREEASALAPEVASGTICLGRYGEPRLIYPLQRREGSLDRKTVCLHVDIFAPAGTAVNAPLSGVISAMETGDSGTRIVLRHKTPDSAAFLTIYDHLDPRSADLLRLGDEIQSGAMFARIASAQENGGWSPRVRVQLAIPLVDGNFDFPDVVDPDDRLFWQAMCPNPAALLNLPDERVAYQPLDTQALLLERKARFGANLKLSYRQPVTLLRGWRHYLFDEMGRTYLDAYNNVPHVGHAHPRIRDVAARQLARMNSNTRYLHPAQTALARRLTDRLPEEFEVCFLVNSGSEANELALRIARAASGGYDMITPDHGYHGNTTGAIDISAYKFNKPGMGGRQPWVHLVDVADDYRGRFRRDDPQRALRYAQQIERALDDIKDRGGKLAGFIAETFPSVGGQIIPPKGYLGEVYARIRAAGGICIADEVQTGLGRLGKYYFGFEQQNVTPDIVVLGKPLGNGHPIGALITTRAIADKFAQGPEYFSTFGGSNLSCLVAAEVLDIVEQESLQHNAGIMGDRLLAGLRELEKRHPTIGDVRGIGLFIGLDLVLDRQDRTPATLVAEYVMNRLRDMRILIGREGPADNILKIRPPLTIQAEDIDFLLERLDTALSEAELALGHRPL